MAKLSLKQVAEIDRRNKGVTGRFYEDVNGYIYVGRDKKLFKFAKCSEVSVDLDSIPGASTVCDALNALKGEITAINIIQAKADSGIKYHYLDKESKVIEQYFQYNLYQNLILDSGARFTINTLGQAVVHTGTLENNGDLIVNGDLIIA